MGRADRPKNIKADKRNLKVIPFTQDAPYYARKGAYYSQKNKPSKALLYLQKAVETEPDDPLNHYNLACLLSKINQLQEANYIFKHIVENMDPGLTECYFFMAVNYGLMEDLAEAKRLLLKYLELTPDGDMAEEAEDLLIAMEDEEDVEAFNQDPSVKESEALMNLVDDLNKVQFKGRLLEDKSFRRVLRWGLYQGGDLLKEAILLLYGDTGCQLARQSLSDFAANPWVNERLRQVALNQLKKINPESTCRVYADGSFREVMLRDCPTPAPTWDRGWQQVLDCAFANMENSQFYGYEFYSDVEAIWLDYINCVYPDGPKVVKSETWAAGLEYCLSRFHFLGLTQKDLAEAYGVSPASVRRKFDQINLVLQIDRKAYSSMLTLLTES